MGSVSLMEIHYGTSAKDAYDSAVADANQYYGHQEGYSGAINSTNGFRVHTLPDGITYGTKKFDIYARKLLDKLNKFDGVLAIELPRKYWKDVDTYKAKNANVDTIVSSGTRKWETSYGILTNDNKLIKELSNKAEAIAYAKKYSISTEEPVRVEVRKKLVGASPIVAKINPVFKNGKEKLKAYLFIGFASI